MKSAVVDGAALREAVALYLDEAYGSAPPRRRVPDLSGVRTLEDAFAVMDDESRRQRGAVVARRHVLRLGNSRYPNMKLVLEEFMLAGRFVFTVDTHDDVVAIPGAPDETQWAELQRWNRAVKRRIEERWAGAGLPTHASLCEHLRRDGRGKPDSRGATVLVVDDEPAIADAVAALLEGEGYRVLRAGDGKEALDRVREERPDLVLMDFEMPRMKGTEACTRLKKAKTTRDIPVLLATAAMIDLASLADADGFLVKPYQRDVLMSFVTALARPRPAADTGEEPAPAKRSGRAKAAAKANKRKRTRKQAAKRRRPEGKRRSVRRTGRNRG